MSTEKEPFNEPETLIDRLLGRYAMGPGNPPEFGYRQIGEPAPIHKEAVREIETLRERVRELKEINSGLVRDHNRNLVHYSRKDELLAAAEARIEKARGFIRQFELSEIDDVDCLSSIMETLATPPVSTPPEPPA